MTVSRWPDDAERAERRAKLHADLDAYLDVVIDDEGKGGFAKVTRDHIHELTMMVNEIIMLKFQRDEEGTIVLAPYFENRRYGRLVHQMLPHTPGMHRSDEDWLRWEMEHSRAAAMLMSEATHAQQRVAGRAQERFVEQQRNKHIGEKIAEVQALVDAGDFAAAEALADKLTIGDKGYSKSTGGRVLDKRPSTPAELERDDPRVETIRAIIAKALYGELAVARDMVANLLDRYQAAAPTDTSVEHTTHEVLATAYRRFGRAAFFNELARYETIGNARRAARKAARQET